MATSSSSKNIFKSIGAVVAGILIIVFLSIVTDTILTAIKIFPPQSQTVPYVAWMLIVALLYRTIYASIGGYVTATLAPNNPMKHVTVLLVIGTVLGTLGAIAGWNLSAHWYPILLVITSALGVWWGGKLKTK